MIHAGHLCYIQKSPVPDYLESIIPPPANAAPTTSEARASETLEMQAPPHQSTQPAQQLLAKDPVFIYVFFDIETTHHTTPTHTTTLTTPHPDMPSKKVHV